MTELLPVLWCKHCKRPIPLPHPNLPGILPSLLAWPMDGRPRNFACAPCGHVYPYRESEVSHIPLSQALGQQGNVMVYPQFLARCVRKRCEQSNCKSQVHIRITQEGELRSIEELVQKSSRWVLHGVECQAGHPITEFCNSEECLEDWNAEH
jgi:hypothetical protein